MRFLAVAVSLLGAAAYASALLARQEYPPCAGPCSLNAPIGNCTSLADVACLCRSPEFVNITTNCIITSCKDNPEGLNQAIQLGKKACELAGVTLTSTPSNLPTSLVGGVVSPTPSPGNTTKSGASTTSRDTFLALGAVAALAALFV